MSKKRRKPSKRRRRMAAPVLPRNVRETFERGEQLVDEIQQGVTLEEAIVRRRAALRELLAPFDAVHVLGQLIFSEAPMDPNTYVECEHTGVAYVVEMVAAEFLRRPGRAGTSDVTPAIDAHLLGPRPERDKFAPVQRMTTLPTTRSQNEVTRLCEVASGRSHLSAENGASLPFLNSS